MPDEKITEQELAEWEKKIDAFSGFSWNVEMLRLIAEVRRLRPKPFEVRIGDKMVGEIPKPEPGQLICETGCPCCGAKLTVEHGDDEGEIAVIGICSIPKPKEIK